MLVMWVKTYGKGLLSVLILMFLPQSSVPASGKGSGKVDVQGTAKLKISVYNDAEVPEGVMSRAEAEAERVFQHAGIEVTWLDCRIPAVNEQESQTCREAVFPDHLHLRIVRKSTGLKAETMGISFQADDGTGCYADLFYEPMQQLRQGDGTDLARLLGHVAAHEIGHLLLGRNSHSAAGIMHAHWTAEELASVRVGGLVFSESESRRMKGRLATTMQASEAVKLSTVESVPSRTGD